MGFIALLHLNPDLFRSGVGTILKEGMENNVCHAQSLEWLVSQHLRNQILEVFREKTGLFI